MSGSRSRPHALPEGWPRAAPILALVAIVVGGCGGGNGGKAQREEVQFYLTSINRTEARSAVAFRHANEALTAWASGRAGPADDRRLAVAVAKIEDARSAVAALPCPPQATSVRRDFLELYDRQVTLAREIRQLARFSAAARATLQRTREAMRARRSQTLTASTLERYARALDGAAADLTAEHAPPVLAPWARDEATWFRRLAAEARRLSSALAAGDARAARIITIRYREIAADRPAATPAQRRAVIRYNAGVDAIARLRARIAIKVAALDKSLR